VNTAVPVVACKRVVSPLSVASKPLPAANVAYDNKGNSNGGISATNVESEQAVLQRSLHTPTDATLRALVAPIDALPAAVKPKVPAVIVVGPPLANEIDDRGPLIMR
jgi:hypothetical protein